MNEVPKFDLTAEYSAEIAPIMRELYTKCKSLGMHFILVAHVRSDETRNEFAHTQVLGQNSHNLLKALALVTADHDMADIILAAELVGKQLSLQPSQPSNNP